MTGTTALVAEMAGKMLVREALGESARMSFPMRF